MEHDIIFDLLPLYHDGVCSAASRAAVEAHLKECGTCREALLEMDAPLPAAEEQKNAADGAVVKGISEAWKKEKWKARLKGAAIAAAVCLLLYGGFYTLTNWNCVKVPTAVLEVTELAWTDGQLSFHLFVNDEKLMHFSYKRYIENYLRKTFDFNGTPIRIFVRNRTEGKGE